MVFIIDETMRDFVVTRGAILKRNADKDFIAVSYTAPKKKKSSEVNASTHSVTDSSSCSHPPSDQSKELRVRDMKKQQEKEMKRARFDIIKFGMSGFDGAKGAEAKIALAVKLGAKPPKKKAQNYKELRLQRQREKEIRKKREQLSGLGKNFARPSFKKKCRKQQGLLNSYGVVTKTAAKVTSNK